MARIFGDVGNRLAQILEAARGSISLDRLNDQDGVHAVYDIARLSEAELYVQSALASIDTGDIAQSVEDQQTITDLPPVFRLLGIYMATDDATRLAQVHVTAVDVGLAGATRDWPLWYWVSGDPTQGRPNNTNIGDPPSVNTLLLPPDAQRFWHHADVITTRDVVKGREGADFLEVRTVSNAFGAGTVRVTGHIVIGYFRRGEYQIAHRPF